MDQKNVEVLFQWLDQTAHQIQEELDITYLEAVLEAGYCFLDRTFPDEWSELTKKRVSNLIDDLTMENLSKEEKRKALQLAILKGMKGSTQHHHMITPDSVAIFVGYLLSKVYPKLDMLRIFDPAVGSANLLTAILNQWNGAYSAFGSEVDTTLIKLALLQANLQEHQIEFFHQDSLRPLLLDPVDAVVSDLPVGYYPDKEQSKSYELAAKEGLSYSHHLFIEQSLRYLVPGGYAIFVIPSFLFDSDQSEELHIFLHKNAHIVGVLQLSETLFKNEQHSKSIFILQKKGENTKAPKEALLVKLPSFKNQTAMNDIVSKINQWFSKEFHNNQKI
ncbi:class I SAM-dependent methyltransferase [Bacillaceae bacterium S4-13-56]